MPCEAGRGVCQSSSLTPTPSCPGLSASWVAREHGAGCLCMWLHIAYICLADPHSSGPGGTNTGTEKRRGRPTVSEEKVVKAVTLSQTFSLTTYQNTTYQAIRIHILIRSLGD